MPTAPPRRVMWLASRMTGRTIAHAVVLGSARTVCRMMEAGGASPAPDGTERCAACDTVLRSHDAAAATPSNVTLDND